MSVIFAVLFIMEWLTVPALYGATVIFAVILRGMADHTSLTWSDCNLSRFIVRGTDDCTSLIWNYRNLHRPFFMA